MIMETKKCNVCGASYTEKRCQACMRRYRKAYKDKYPARIRANTRKWRKNNLEKVREGDRRRQRRRNRRQVEKNTIRREWLKAGDLTRGQLIDVFEQHNEQCHYCEERILRPCFSPDKLNGFDHKTPHSRGGVNTISNIIPCCNQCNMQKNTKTYEEYLGYLEEIRHDKF